MGKQSSSRKARTDVWGAWRRRMALADVSPTPVSPCVYLRLAGWHWEKEGGKCTLRKWGSGSDPIPLERNSAELRYLIMAVARHRYVSVWQAPRQFRSCTRSADDLALQESDGMYTTFLQVGKLLKLWGYWQVACPIPHDFKARSAR